MNNHSPRPTSADSISDTKAKSIIQGELDHFMKNRLREELCPSDRLSIDIVKEALKQELTPMLQASEQNIASLLTGHFDAIRKEILNSLREIRREEMAQESPRRELNNGVEGHVEESSTRRSDQIKPRSNVDDMERPSHDSSEHQLISPVTPPPLLHTSRVSRKRVSLNLDENESIEVEPLRSLRRPQRDKTTDTALSYPSSEGSTRPDVRNAWNDDDSSDRPSIVPERVVQRSMSRRSRTNTSSTLFCLDQHVGKLDSHDRGVALRRSSLSSLSPAPLGDLAVGTAPYTRRTAKDYAQLICKDTRFDSVYGALIMVNAVIMGVQTDVLARSSSEITPLPLQICNIFFCVAFSSELIVRFTAFRFEFFYMPGWHWNWFDSILVAMQLFEETVALVAKFNQDDDTQGGGNLSFLRVLRVFRLVRLVRLARVLRLIRPLRTLVHSIGESLASLGWTVLLLFILIYIIAIYFTQSVSNRRHSLSGAALQTQHIQKLDYYFGTLGRSILSLFEAAAGGADWDDLADPLIHEISPFVCILFVAYVAFVVLAMLNVITGVFVDSALQAGATDKETQCVAQLKEMFTEFNPDNSATISKDDFEKVLTTREAQQTLKSCDVKEDQARNLFNLVDVEGIGTISINAFIMGCLRLRGSARAADMTTLIYDFQAFRKMWRAHAEFMENHLADVVEGNIVGPTCADSNATSSCLGVMGILPTTELQDCE